MVALLANCGNKAAPTVGDTSRPEPSIQEGIGGDLAVIVVKSLVAIDLRLSEVADPPDPTYEKRKQVLRTSPALLVHSTEELRESLFSWDEEILIIDRKKLGQTSSSEVVNQFLAALGSDLKSVLPDSFNLGSAPRDFDLRTSRLETEQLLAALTDYISPFPQLPVDLQGSYPDYTPRDRVRQLTLSFAHIDFQESNDRLIDSTSKWGVDFITLKAEPRNRRSPSKAKTKVLLSSPRLASMRHFTNLIPILMLHEASNVAMQENLEDDTTYAFTMELITTIKEMEMLKASPRN